MNPLFNRDDQPNAAIEEIANGFEENTRNFLLSLTRQGYTLTDIRAVGGYLMQAVSGSISWAVLDAREFAFAEARRLADPNLNEEEIALVRDDKKIGAIKEYRQRTGLGLREAKDAVEGWMLKNLGYANKPKRGTPLVN